MQRQLSFLTGTVYQKALKPLLFCFPAETVHQTMVRLGSSGCQFPWLASLMKAVWSYQDWRIMKHIDGITFPNPVGLAAGFDYDADLLQTLPSMGFGFHTIGTITLEAYEGNQPPRLSRFPDSQALLVNKGLKNIGAKAIIAKLKNQEMKIPTGISIASTNKFFNDEAEQIAEIKKCFRLFEKSGLKHAYYELNISCPNTFGGEPFTTPTKLERLMQAMDSLHLSRPLWVKMPIDQDDASTVALLKVLDGHTVQGVIFGNLTKDKKNPDVAKTDQEKWQTMKGNVSGKPTFKRSNHCIALTRKKFKDRFTIIGTGGIFSGEDAAQKLKLGADAVQLISGMIYKGPQLIGQINQHLATHKL